MDKHFNILLWFLIIGGICISGCSGISTTKKVFYINSYHAGYAASDSVMKGLNETLPSAIELKTFYLNTKQLSEHEIRTKVDEALAQIRAYRPNIIIASDDDAVKRLIVPFFKNASTPVVFCGVNWTASGYGLPFKNCTGMLEVLPLRETINAIKTWRPGIKKFTVLSEYSTSELKNKEVLDTLFRNEGLDPEYILVKNFDEWKRAFSAANKSADLIYLPTNGAIKNWNKQEALLLVQQQLKTPVITCDDFMMPYAVLGFTKVASEQGEWAAVAAMQILAGTDPQKIPVTKNRKVRGWLNKELADKIAYKPDSLNVRRLTLLEPDSY